MRCCIRCCKLNTEACELQVTLAAVLLNASQALACLTYAILYLFKHPLSCRAIRPLDEAQIFGLLHLLELLSISTYFPCTVEAHDDGLGQADAQGCARREAC